jgi:hypothetical protein
MTPLPVNPKVVILVDEAGSWQAIASNIDPELYVNITDNPAYFDEAAKGLPFNSLNQPTKL